MKRFSETLQNLLYIWNMKTQVVSKIMLNTKWLKEKSPNELEWLLGYFIIYSNHPQRSKEEEGCILIIVSCSK